MSSDKRHKYGELIYNIKYDRVGDLVKELTFMEELQLGNILENYQTKKFLQEYSNCTCMLCIRNTNNLRALLNTRKKERLRTRTEG